MHEMSRSRRTRLLDEMLGSCRHYIATDFTPALRRRIEAVVGDGSSWQLAVDTTDPYVVNFEYPASSDRGGYVRPVVRLELGTHAELVPSDRYTITPYAADHFPAVFDDASCKVRAIRVERTFWEKATILHQEHFRSSSHGAPSRYSRHYYDVFMLAQQPAIRTAALGSVGLLARVVAHKDRFYSRSWARYDLAVPATLQLLPSTEWIDYLRRDYASMEQMFFGKHPDFDAVLDGLRDLEQDIRRMG